jgi:hypothetical protein
MNKENSFFKSYQKENTLRMLKESLEKTIKEWLKSDDENHTKLTNLQQFSELDIDSPALLTLPHYVMQLWNEPHQAITALAPEISKKDIRNLIQITVKEQIELGKVSNLELS